MSDVVYKTGDTVGATEMMALAEAVGFGPHRTLDRNERALKGSLFVATGRLHGQLIGLIRLVGDGAYILHIADMMVHPAHGRQGIGSRLVELAIDFAKEIATGTGDTRGEFTLFAAEGAEFFYEKHQFMSVANGMCLADSPARRRAEQTVVDRWAAKVRADKQMNPPAPEMS